MARLSTQKRRVLLIVLGGIAVLAAIFFVTKLVMPHTAPTNPIAAITSAPGKARAVAAASDAASAKLNAGGSTSPTSTAPQTAGVAPVAGGRTAASSPNVSGPVPNTTRNPFLP